MYSRLTSTTKQQIERFGRECTWRQFDVRSINPDKPWLSQNDTDTYTDYSTHILFLPSSSPRNSYIRLLSDSTLVVGDDYGLMGYSGFTPNNNDHIYDENGEHLLRIVKSIEQLAPSGDPIMYTVQFVVSI